MSKSGCMEGFWSVRAQQKSHPFVLETLQIIYWIQKRATKHNTYWQLLLWSFVSPFFSLVEEIKAALKIYSLSLPQCMYACCICTVWHPSLSWNWNTIVLTMAHMYHGKENVQWAYLFSEKALYIPKGQNCAPCLESWSCITSDGVHSPWAEVVHWVDWKHFLWLNLKSVPPQVPIKNRQIILKTMELVLIRFWTEKFAAGGKIV